MENDIQHLKLLSIFNYVFGAINAMFSCFFIIYIVMGAAMLNGAMGGPSAPPKAIGWMFIIMGSFGIIWGLVLSILMIILGRKLARHKAWMFCIVAAGIECLVIPLGTVLGVFTIVVLTRDPVKQLFQSPIGRQDDKGI